MLITYSIATIISNIRLGGGGEEIFLWLYIMSAFMVEICHKLDLLFVLKAFIPDFHLIFFQVFYFRILTEFYNGCIAHSVSTAIIKFMLTIVKQMYFYMHNLFILWGLNNKVNHKCHVCWLGFPLLTTGNYKKEKTMSGVGQSVWCECRFWIDYRHFFFFFLESGPT